MPTHRQMKMARRMTRRGILFPLFALAFAAVGFAMIGEKAEAAAGQQDMGRQLVQGLKATEGCLGVQTGDTDAGHSMIMAWFENKAAALRWYDSPVHRGMMRAVGGAGGGDTGEPMAHVPDDVPIFVIAAITFSDRPEIPGVPIPIKQISIEMYTPLPGGAFINGRVAPDSLKVPHMDDYSPKSGNAGGGYGGGR